MSEVIAVDRACPACMRFLPALLTLTSGIFLAACDLGYPEVVVVNRTDDTVLLKNPSFNGCVWNVVLAYGGATPPGRCLPGMERVHFQKFAAATYCQAQAADGTLRGVCPCEGGVESGQDGGVMEDLKNSVPTWFNYQTISDKSVDYGEFHLFEITLTDMEQDFSVPGPYGHGH